MSIPMHKTYKMSGVNLSNGLTCLALIKSKLTSSSQLHKKSMPFIKMETQLKEETSLLQTLQEINKDAVHLKTLIRHQVHSENLKRPLRVLKSPVPRIAKTTIFLRPYDSLLTIFLVRLNGALR